MTDISIIALAAVLFGITWASLKRKGGIYEYPFLVAMVFAGFVLIQAVGLRSASDLPPGSLAMVMAMSILCALACYFGFKCAGHRMIGFDWTFDERKLLLAGSGLVAFGVFFWILIARLPTEQTNVTQWTGTPVAYQFFAQSASYGLAIALLVFLRTGRKAALVPIAAGVLMFADLAIMSVRRADTCELFLMILLGIWFVKRRALPRTAVFALLFVATLAVYAIGDLRSTAKGDKAYASILKGDAIPSIADFSKIDFWDKTSDVIQNGAPEIRNAAHIVAAVQDGLSFDFGLNDWNAVIFRFIPAQLIGQDIKSGLMIPFESPLFTGVIPGYEPTPGATFTGIADAFGSFWYFGFVKFLFIGWVLGTLYNGAMRGSVLAAVLYIVSITDGLQAVTHNTQYFICRLIHVAIFAVPVLWYARVSGRVLQGADLRIAAVPALSAVGDSVNASLARLPFKRRGIVPIAVAVQRGRDHLWPQRQGLRFGSPGKIADSHSSSACK